MRHYRSLAVTLLLGISFACQPIRSQPASDPVTTETQSALATPIRSQPLTFPPELGKRQKREPLPERFGVEPQGEEEPTNPQVAYPRLDDGDDTFEFSGQTLRIVFDRGMKRPKDEKTVKKGQLTIEPPVEGKAAWTGHRYLEFEAKQPFDPDTTYTVTLNDLEDEKGKALGAWKANFTAEPQIHIAGKVIGYLPEDGKHRVVATSPLGGEEVGSNYTLAVLYDQPIQIDEAKKVVELRDSSNKDVGFSLSRPKRKTFRGIKVDPSYVVVLKPEKKLEGGENYEIVAKSNHPDDSSYESEFSIAQPLAFESVDCGYGYDDTACEWDDGVLKTDGKEVVLAFNNAIADDSDTIVKHLTVSPQVRNLSVWSSYYEGRVYLYGGFEPSKKYKVTLRGVKDVYGNKLEKPVSFKIETESLPASASMPEGILVLDEKTTKGFGITTRNVSAAHLMMWPVEDDAKAWSSARSQVDAGKLPDGVAPIQIRFTPKLKRDEHVVTNIDLSKYLYAGREYVATIKLEKTAFGAHEMEFPEWSDAGRPSVAMLTPGYGDALALHLRASSVGTIVHVAKLDDGTPVKGAQLYLSKKKLRQKTDDQGFAFLDRNLEDIEGDVLRAVAGKVSGRIEISTGAVDERRLVPELASGFSPNDAGLVGMIVTDRGIYRPGAKVFIKGTARRKVDDRLSAVPLLPLRLRVLGPGGEEVFSAKEFADEMGTITAEFDVPSSESLGRHRIILEPALDSSVELASEIVQIAEFEPPRFTVDVKAKQEGERKLSATVVGKYLFGAAMDGAYVDWSLRRKAASFPSGPFTAAGFDFRKRASWWDDDEGSEDWVRTGSGTLDDGGLLKLEQSLEIDAKAGPQKFTLEASVADESYRTIANRGSVTLHPNQRYAGLKVGNPWADVGEAIPVELGVIDTDGQPVIGAEVTARLDEVVWKETKKRGPNGSISYDWHRSTRHVQTCKKPSEQNAVVCELTPPVSGDYEITALVDGKSGGVRSLWAWDDDWNEPVKRPEKGKRLELVTDKRSYDAGDKAKILVTNPFPAATAIFTVEQDGIVHHERRRIEGAATMFEVPIEAKHAPHVHATVTLLPINAKGDQVAQWRFGAARLKVADDSSRLAVELASDKEAYEPGQDGSIKIKVLRNGKPAANTEVALAVVDEGILRLTNFKVADPVKALRPGRSLQFLAVDTRDRLAAAHERSHIAGDGAGDGSQSMTEARKDFVKTLMWKPTLRTNEKGEVEVPVDMPDNLTTFRMMAVALDGDGKGGSAESKFLVRKPVMIVPAVPRFAGVGDEFEAAAMVHNNTKKRFRGRVRLMSVDEKVDIKPGKSKRVPFRLSTNEPRELLLDFSILDETGKVYDRVESRVPVQAPGIDERPRLTGAFVHRQEIALEIPSSAQPDRTGQDFVEVTVGQHLAPGLGTRLEYLIDYPHGCVEQTTSSTLPLIAAREILPRVGITRVDRTAIDDMIKSGLERLDSMKTSSGGLAYWPGGHQPNVYGTAYAMRAVVSAKLAGIESPPGLLPGMRSYLETNLMSTYVEPEVRAAIAQSLAELKELPESSADSLWDTKDNQGVFGLASLAIALDSLDGQNDRVKELLDEVEGSFSREGKLEREPGSNDFYYYGSSKRTRAQAAIALARLRPNSKVLVMITSEMGRDLPSYTTQSTAYELLALAERMQNVSEDGVPFQVTLNGELLTPHRDAGYGTKSYRIPLAQVRGKRGALVLESQSDEALAFIMGARWRRGLEDAMGLTRTTGSAAPDVYRLYTDPNGKQVDLGSLAPGTVLRVALLVQMPIDEVDHDRIGYLAITDRLPAGVEAVQPDLWTVAKTPELDEKHPFYSVLRWSSNDASHVEMHDDRVDLYFDKTWGRWVGATYMVRTTTPGSYVVPPPMAELMYEPDGVGYGDPMRVVIK
jgi:hypothetical protein